MKYEKLKNNCRELFMAVCDDLGAYFSEQGFKYARSTPKLTYKYDKFKLQISFYSSHSNITGKYVLLEIIPYIFVTDRSIMADDRRGKDIISYEFTQKSTEAEQMQCRILKYIFGDVQYQKISDFPNLEACIEYSNSEDLILIDDEKFELLKEFISEKIIAPAQRLVNSDLLEKRSEAFKKGEISFTGIDTINSLTIKSHKNSDNIFDTELNGIKSV